ncbi:MAG TPA: M67 family metallopeptidase [Thermoplasmata archaeon]|nr:M67 family metallopeptidase [Thermoplasmata archaeon]
MTEQEPGDAAPSRYGGPRWEGSSRPGVQDGPLFVTTRALQSIQSHAVAAYPLEACGFLLGPARSYSRQPWRVDTAVEATNGESQSPGTRFSIGAHAVFQHERRAAANGAAVIGFYHSHPDRPAQPSALDQMGSPPGFAHLIVGVSRRRTVEWRAFVSADVSGGLRQIRAVACDTSEGAAGSIGGNHA